MSGIATAVVASTVVGGYISSKNADKAAEAQAESAQTASDTELTMFNKSTQLTEPWRKAGEKALGKLEKKVYAGPGDYTKSPGYDFRLSEGNKAIERSAASKGGLVSGRTLKALDRYSQDYATNDYDNFLNRYYQSLTPLQSLAGVGQTTATNQANQATQTGRSVAENQLSEGQARATGYINQGNAWTGAINSGIGALGDIYGWGKK